MTHRFRHLMSAAAFVSGIVAPAAVAQVAPAPGQLAGVNIGSIQTAPTGVPTVGVNLGQTVAQEGHAATATLLGPNSVADVSFANLTTPERTQVADVIGVAAGPVAVTQPNDGGSVVGLALAGAASAAAHTLGLAVGAPGAPAAASVGGKPLAVPGWSGVPGLSLPFLRPRGN